MLGNPVFSCFVFYATLLILKMYIIAIITGQVRLRKKVRLEGTVASLSPPKADKTENCT